MRGKYAKALLENKCRVGVWGSGYIGFTTAINFAINGVETLCYDISAPVIEKLKKGEVNIPNLEYWIGFPIKPLINRGLLGATSRLRDMKSPKVKVHMIAVPTERGGEPWAEPLQDVVGKIASRTADTAFPDLIIIESTLTPKDIERIVLPTLKRAGRKPGKDVLVGVAPRRDWFHSPEKNLRNLPRIYAGIDERSSQATLGALSVICNNLIPASSTRVAELVKAVENSLLHVPSVYAMQLALSYPDIDISEVLKLTATHWRIPLYYPTIGTGGYCIPVSSKYVKLGATRPEHLTIIDETLKYDGYIADLIVDHVVKKKSPKVGILGLCYKGDLKVHTLSPAMKVAELLRARKIDTLIHDPYYTDAEIKRLTGFGSFTYPEDLGKFDTLVIVPDHRIYTQTPVRILSQFVKKGQEIYDNSGTWEKFRGLFDRKGVRYHKVGDAGWLPE